MPKVKTIESYERDIKEARAKVSNASDRLRNAKKNLDQLMEARNEFYAECVKRAYLEKSHSYIETMKIIMVIRGTDPIRKISIDG